MASRVASKIKLQTVDELLGVPSTEGTVDLDIRKITPFENHPFKVLDDEKMADLVESINTNGVLTPVLVRPDDEGNFEMISGHRRLHAAKLAGLDKIPAIVKEMTDDEATIAMVDANVQREEILPSERAFSLKMKLDAIKRQGARTDLTLSPKETKLGSDEIVGKGEGLARAQVHRYIRLVNLTPELLNMVDEKRLAIAIAVDISYFEKNVQQWLYEYIKENGMIKQDQIAVIKPFRDDQNMTQEQLISLLVGSRPVVKKSRKVTLSEKSLNIYFPPYYTENDMEKVITELLTKWKLEQEASNGASTANE